MAWSLIQSLKSTTTGGASTAVTAAFASSVTSGNRIFMFTTAFNGSSTTDIAAPTKSAGTATISAFTKLATASATPSTGKLFIDIWTATVTTGGTCTLSATSTSTSGSELGWSAQEYSGLDASAGSGCLDVSAAGTGNVSSTATIATGTTAATSGANQLALAMVGDWGDGVTWTLSTANGFTKVAGASIDADASAGMAVANKTSASGATESCVWTDGAVSNTDNACVVVIKLASGGGTPVALTGAVAAVTIAAPAGTVATQVDIALTGAVASVTIGAPAGTVLAAGPISLTGAVAAVTVAAPAGTVSATSPIALTGAVTGVTTAAPAGTVALNVSLTASPASVVIAAPGGSVATQGSVSLTGAVAAVTTAAPAGTVATVILVALTGAVANVTTAAPAGTVSVQIGVSLTGAVAAITTAAPAGTIATGGSVNLPGPVATVAAAAPAGTVSVQALVTLTGVPAALTIAAPAGTISAAASTPVTLSGSVSTLTISAPEGSVTAIVSVTYVFVPPTQNLHYGNWFTEPLTSRIPYPTGACVLKSGGFYTTRWDAPVEADIENADTVYLGGHEYVISADEAAALTAAGYAANITTR